MAKIMQIPSPVHSDIPAVKYGCWVEDVTAVEYQRIMTKHKHKHFHMKHAGLFIIQEYCYIGASADRFVCCHHQLLVPGHHTYWARKPCGLNAEKMQGGYQGQGAIQHATEHCALIVVTQWTNIDNYRSTDILL